MMCQERMELILDAADARAVHQAFAAMQLCRDKDGVILADGDSNLAGAMVAEMVRDWLEYRAIFQVDPGPAGG